MRLYELVVILDPRLSGDDVAAARATVEGLVGASNIKDTDDLGLQHFTHNRKDNLQLNKGYVLSYAVEINPEDLDKINTELGYNKQVVRHAVFVLDHADDFAHFEKNVAAAQELADNEEWSIKKSLTIFADKKSDYLFNWKSVPLLEKFMTRFGDIKPRKYTGVSVSQQKKIRTAIIRSRTLGFLPFIK